MRAFDAAIDARLTGRSTLVASRKPKPQYFSHIFAIVQASASNATLQIYLVTAAIASSTLLIDSRLMWHGYLRKE